MAQEDLAGSVQAWFNSSTEPGSGVWEAPTRSALKQQFPGEYGYLAARFDATNTWVPLRPVRDQPHEPSPLDRLPTDNGAEFSFTPDVRYFADEGDHCLVMQSDGNLVLYSSTTARWAAPTGLTWRKGAQAGFTSDGTLVVRDGKGVSLWETPTKGNPGAQLSLTTSGSLQIIDVLGKVIWRSDAS